MDQLTGLGKISMIKTVIIVKSHMETCDDGSGAPEHGDGKWMNDQRSSNRVEPRENSRP